MENLRYFIAKPTATRKTFALVCYTLITRTNKKYQPLTLALRDQIKSINEKFLSKIIDAHEVVVLLNDIIQIQYRKNNVKDRVLKNSVISGINQKIFNDFWEVVYSIRFLEDEDSPKYDLLKAIRLIEPLSLQTSTAQELQIQLKKNIKNVNEHRRACDRLNQLLKFVGRDFKLNKPKEGRRIIQYLTKPEFEQMLPFIEDKTLKDFATTLFCTGTRLSEALALTPNDLFDGKVNIDKQLTEDGITKKPKREKVGHAAIIPFGLEAVKRWVEIDQKAIYRYRLFDCLFEASSKAFPNDRNKWIGPHDLRHSHAIYLLGRGANLKQVALNLRNRYDVCEKYYVGFSHTDESLDGLKKII